MRRAARKAGRAEGATERQRIPKETVAKVPLQASENARERNDKGVGLGLHAFLQQSPKQPDPKHSEGARLKINFGKDA